MLESDVIKKAIFNLRSENEDKIYKECTYILCKYFQNIVDSPDEPKYRCIKSSNQTFQSKLGHVRGVEDVFLKTGFTKCDSE